MTEAEGRELAAAMEQAVKAKTLLRLAVMILSDGPASEDIDARFWLREARKFLGMSEAA